MRRRGAGIHLSVLALGSGERVAAKLRRSLPAVLPGGGPRGLHRPLLRLTRPRLGRLSHSPDNDTGI